VSSSNQACFAGASSIHLDIEHHMTLDLLENDQ